MNVYLREIKASRRSMLAWSLGILFFVAASMSKFSVMAGSSSMMELFDGLPIGMQALFGIGQLDFSTASGFYAMVFPYLLLMVAIHASMLGAVILSKEERDKTTEFLYAKPASRTQILTAKLLAALTQVLTLTLVNWIAAIGAVLAFGENTIGMMTLLVLGMALVQLVFLALGIAAAAAVKRPKAATGVATGAMLTAYLLSVSIDLNSGISWMAIFTPFQYFDAKDIVGAGTGLSLPYALLCVGLVAGLLGLSYLRFEKRDLQV